MSREIPPPLGVDARDPAAKNEMKEIKGNHKDRLDADQISQALRRSEIIRANARLADIDVRPIGVGHAGDVFKVVLQWAGPGDGPTSVVVKLPSTDPASAETARQIGAYQRERIFYQELASELVVNLPRFLGVIEFENGLEGLILEDLSVRTSGGSQLSSAPLAELKLARRQLVQLQAPFWGDDKFGSSPWLHRRLGVPIPEISARMQRSWESSKQWVGGNLSPDEFEVVDRFVGQAESWALALEAPFSLVHHDFRFDNLLFSESEVYVLDWQTIGWGAPMFDLAYLIGTSLDRETRNKIERDEVLCHVEELSEKGVHHSWTGDEAWTAYRRAAFAILLMLVPACGSVRRTSRGDEMFSRLIRQGAQQVLDLDAIEFLEPV